MEKVLEVGNKVKIKSEQEFIDFYGDIKDYKEQYPVGWVEEMNTFFDSIGTVDKVNEHLVYSPVLVSFEGNSNNFWYTGYDVIRIDE